MSVLGNKISEFLLNTNNFKVVRGTVNKLFLDLVLKNVRIKIYFSLFHVDVDPTTCQTEKKRRMCLTWKEKERLSYNNN